MCHCIKRHPIFFSETAWSPKSQKIYLKKYIKKSKIKNLCPLCYSKYVVSQTQLWKKICCKLKSENVMFFQKYPLLIGFLFIIRKRIRKTQKIQKQRQKCTCVWNFNTIVLIKNKIDFRVDASLNYLRVSLLNIIYPLQYPLQYPTSTSKQITLRTPPPSLI